MKLHGGSYDFKGSNSGIDLFSFTGWIPEQIFFQEDASSSSLSSAATSDGGGQRQRRRPPVLDHRQPAERAWERLRSAFRFGDCLTTIATSGGLDEREAEALGLVPGHAYGVVDVRECLGKRFLLVKNPWARKSWKGPYSAQDRARWTPELCAALGYDPELARKADDGVFWIDWWVLAGICFAVLCLWTTQHVRTHIIPTLTHTHTYTARMHNRVHARQYFSNLFLNWNPDLFLYRTFTHALWPAAVGPRNDSFNYGQNPQFILDLDADGASGSVWVLLTRHVTTEEALEAEDYLTLHVYKGEQGRVIYPSEGRVCQGVYRCVRGLSGNRRTDSGFHTRGLNPAPPNPPTQTDSNNPHNLTRLDVDAGCQRYALVLSQYEKARDLAFTLSIYATRPFTLRPAPPLPPAVAQLEGVWDSQSAGGRLGQRTFMHNVRGVW